MKLCRFINAQQKTCIGLVSEPDSVLDLSPLGICRMQDILESADLLESMSKMTRSELPRHSISQVRLLAPVEQQEVWAAGVTYLRSKSARMEESTFSASAYDRVYEAARPELFFKSLPEKVVGPDEPVGIRKDGRWNVPEPELALVLNSRGEIKGYTIGNDMSSRDIEGENLLYLPQAKTYHRSCALGPCISLGITESEARSWKIRIEIERQGQVVFDGKTTVDQIKRSFAELAEYLFRSQNFPSGAILLTGTGIVPPDDFSLKPDDRVRISISGIGVLSNPVIQV
jgi:2-dehydro-3-deoxy-D-arabinonate dehydratase